jgi:hypothetical protein
MLKRLFDVTLGSFEARVRTLFACIWGIVFSLVLVPLGLGGGIKRCILYGALLAAFLYYLYCRITKRSERFTGFIEALVLSLIVYFFVSARVGLFIAITLFVVPLLSMLGAAVVTAYVSINLTVDKELVNKGEPVNAVVRVSNHSILPSPPLVFRLRLSEHFKTAVSDTYTVFVMPRSTEEFRVELSGKICGPASVSIESVEIRNHLGARLLTRDLKDTLCETVAIVPEVPKSAELTDIVRSVINTAHSSDDSEDTVEGVGNVFSGFPGYENREYVPGDPLKRINWKQSAKRGRLLVRKEDEAELSTVYVWLDRCFSLLSDTETAALCAQACIENSLALALSLVKAGCHVVYVNWRDGWVTSELNTETKLNELTQHLAYYRFEKSVDMENRFPPKQINGKDAKNILLCTPFFEADLTADNIAVYSAVEAGSELYDSLKALSGEGENGE